MQEYASIFSLVLYSDVLSSHECSIELLLFYIFFPISLSPTRGDWVFYMERCSTYDVHLVFRVDSHLLVPSRIGSSGLFTYIEPWISLYTFVHTRLTALDLSTTTCSCFMATRVINTHPHSGKHLVSIELSRTPWTLWFPYCIGND